ncbi:hypothetical protein [Flavisphingomonas formosensis]|nr:hypothetical protein [Sphingomonas formosensis]
MPIFVGQPGLPVRATNGRLGQGGIDRAAIGLCGLAIIAIASFLYPLIG